MLRKLRGRTYCDLPVLGAAEVAVLEQFVSESEAALAGCSEKLFEDSWELMDICWPQARQGDARREDIRLETYTRMLVDLPGDILTDAIKTCLCTYRFFPTIAEIFEAARPALEAPQGEIDHGAFTDRKSGGGSMSGHTSLTAYAGCMREPDPERARKLAQEAYRASGGEIVMINRGWLTAWTERQQLTILGDKVHGKAGVR